MDLNLLGSKRQIECHKSGLTFVGHDERERNESGEQPPQEDRKDLYWFGRIKETVRITQRSA